MIPAKKVVAWTCVSLASLVVIGLPDFDGRDYVRLYGRLEVGMTPEQVSAIAGEPDRANGSGEWLQLVYHNLQVFQGFLGRPHKVLVVNFESGRTTSVRFVQDSKSVSKPHYTTATR
jgi:hypothetical protein